MLLLSPHPDDIAATIGGWLASVKRDRPSLLDDIEIFTGFMWSKSAPHAPDADGDSVRVTRLRKAEEEKFCRNLGVKLSTGMLPDTSVLNIDMRAPVDLATDQRLVLLEELLEGRLAGRVLFAPVSLGEHVDHRIVAETAHRSAGQAVLVVYYEDLPYASWYENDERFTIIRNKLGEKALPFCCELDAALRDAKRRNLGCYPSQLNDEEIESVLSYLATGTDTSRERIWVEDPTQDQIRYLENLGFTLVRTMPGFG